MCIAYAISIQEGIITVIQIQQINNFSTNKIKAVFSTLIQVSYFSEKILPFRRRNHWPEIMCEKKKQGILSTCDLKYHTS